MSSETPFPGLVGTAAEATTVAAALEANGVTFDGEGVPEVDQVQRATAAALWFAYLNEAATMLEQGYATRDDIDASMRFGCGYSAGPLQQLDVIGL
ncbi:MAG: 3-hydroxyacyl-CoA dehydrogenase family protein, partial [Candidatus Nanopelagicales bacterium]